jgi:hypothetical protein
VTDQGAPPRAGAERSRPKDEGDRAAHRAGGVVLGGAAAVFVAIGAPVVWRGAPLADDFNNCLAPMELGLGGFLASSWDRLGMVRPARFLEILLTTWVCQTLPFGFAIVVPLLLTLAVALLARNLLRDLGVPAPWPELAAALWLLQPLGTEAALWPAALHVPLGLALALVALRLHHRGVHGWAAAAGLAAALSVEQVILALPLAAWVVAPAAERRRAAATSAGVALAVLTAFAIWPGTDARLEAGVVERVAGLFGDLTFYVAYPAVGVGAHSIPLAVIWALPWSLAALAVGVVVGAAAGRRLPIATRPGRSSLIPQSVAVGVMVLLANAPVVLAVPRQGSPRVFAPTWLILAIALPALAAHVPWRRRSWLGAGAGLFAAGAVLSLALSVTVRLASADFTEQWTQTVAAEVPDEGDVAVCGIRRTVTEPAPRGAFAVHELVYDWAAEHALAYYTGVRASFHLAGELGPGTCPGPDTVDAVFSFDELIAVWRR